MRVAIVSDIHSNRRALQAVLSDLRDAAPDLVVHGGDLVAGGAYPAEVIDQVRTLGWPGVRGNTDEMMWTSRRLTELAAAQPQFASIAAMVLETISPTVAMIGPERLRWLEALPMQYMGPGFSLVHGSPGDCWRSPMANAGDEQLRSTYAPLGLPIVVYGHIHVPYIRRLDGLTVANAGSVSQSYDGDTRASYLVIDGLTDAVSGVTEGARFTTRRVEYDVQSEADDLLRSGLPHADWMARVLLAGRYVAP